MTPADELLYNYLLGYNSVHGKLPTQKEIAFDLGKDHSVISKQMIRLANEGYLTATYHKVMYSLKRD